MCISVLRRVAFAVLAIFFLSGSDCGSHPPPPLQTPQVEFGGTLLFTPPACGGGTGAPAANMNSTAQTLANLIATSAFSDNIGAPSATTIGVAQWHATDMAQRGVVSLIGSDGEDAVVRITCSGGAPDVMTGVAAIGFSTSPDEVLNALLSNTSASLMFQQFSLEALGNSTSTTIAVGYNSGYWMIILQIPTVQ